MIIQIKKDTITPGLEKLAEKIRDKKPILEAMGLQLQTMTVQSFSSPGKRPAPWANKADGSPSNLEGPAAVASLLTNKGKEDRVEI